jgi:hypothetical protein
MRDTCDACHSNPPKNHICEIRDGQQTTRDLCDACFATYRMATGGQFPPLGEQRCYYCGAPAQATAPNMEWEQRARGQPFHHTCFRCGLVYSEVVLASLAEMPEGLTADAQVEALVGLTSEADRRVRERVRGNEV